MPDIPHAIVPLENSTYSMLTICVPINGLQNKMQLDLENEIGYTESLKEIIKNTPENQFLIKEMARSIGISPYHMIRRFKKDCGLTPHQFQIQCRVRKAQKLLEQGKSMTDVAYATGFCDQSHFNHCFYKVVRLTPNEYRNSVRKLS